MHSVSQPIPRCVLAQSYLESIDRTNNNSINSTDQHSHGDDLMHLDDRNSDLDEQYQQLVHLNGPQSRHHNSNNSNQHQLEGIVQLKHVQQQQQLQHYLQQQQQLVYYGRTTEDNDDRLQKYNTVTSREHNLQRVATSIKSTSPSSLSSPAVIARTNQNPSVPPPPFLQVSPQHQQQLNQQHFQHTAGGNACGAYEHPPYQHHSHQNHNQRQHHHLYCNQIQHNHKHHQQHYSRADMSRLEAMFPPLHDSVDDSSSSTSTTPSIPSTLSSSSPTAKAAAEALMSALDQGIQRPSTPHAGLLTTVSPKPTRPQRLVPPPILIPRDIALPSSSPQHEHPSSTQHLSQDKVVVAPIATQNQQHLPSPVPSATSPESPSSLAIHLYVHHHHHHHPQESASSSSAVVLQDGSSSLSSSSCAAASLSSSTASVSPMVLLSPLTFPHPAIDHHLYQQQQHLQGSIKSASVASLPSPPLSTSESELSQLPSPPPVQLVSLLPPLSIPSINDNKSNDALLTPPASTRSPLLMVSSVSKAGEPTSANEDPSSSLPWFNHPQSLANTTSTKNHLNNEQRQYQQKRHRQHRNHQPRPQLPDSALASQLLSTISSKDLARLYVHAAHHLHSHQPIRRYVMMKMIMTQAELAQYGRLRAEMPRAPGPSTGAQPKRNGFGSPAQSGFEFRPKKPSRLGRYMYSAAAFLAPAAPALAARWGTAGSRIWGNDEDMGMEVWNEKSVMSNKKKLTSLAWTQSLSSLVSLTKRTTSITPTNSTPSPSVSEPNLYCSGRRLEELELGHNNHRKRINTSVRQPQQQQGGNRSSSSSSSIRRRGVDGGRMYSEDDCDDGEGSEDTETGDDFEGEEEDDFDDEEIDEEEEKPMNYWTMLRTRSNKNSQSRKHNLRHASTNDQGDKEARLHLNMQLQQQQDKEQLQYYQQQQQQQQQKMIPLQQFDPQVIIYPSSTKPTTASTNTKSKSHARRRTALTNTINNGSHSPSSISPYSSPNSSSSESNYHRHHNSSSPSTNGGAILPTGSGSTTASFTETYGVSGLLMLALFFAFLFLLEGTNHFYKVQSALLSIIL